MRAYPNTCPVLAMYEKNTHLQNTSKFTSLFQTTTYDAINDVAKDDDVGRLDLWTTMNDSNTAITKEEELVVRGSLAKEELKHHYSVY